MNRRHFLGRAAMGAVGAIALPDLGSARKSGSDIALLREILTTLHPGLYRYARPAVMEHAFAKLERAWPTQSLEQRFLGIAALLSTIKCGHSYPNFFNQTDSLKTALFDRPTRLPFTFRWIGDQMVVLDGQAEGAKLPRGSVVKAINGVPCPQILSRLLPLVRADGSNDGKRKALLSMTGADGLETFDIFHGLIYGVPPQGFHRIRYRAPGANRDMTVDVPVISLAQRVAAVRQSPKDGSPEWEWHMRPDGIAILRMDGWALYNSKWKWEDWLNERLDSLRGSRGLIVDIRENEGGNDCGDVILSRLAGSDIVRPKARRLVRYARVPDHLNPYLDTWDPSFRDWSNDVERFDDRYFLQKGVMADPVIPVKGPRVTVPMAVLTSSQNSSATFQFASLVRATGLGRLIGETTGGNLRGINGGAFFFARLPECGIEFDVPLVGYFPEGPTSPDAGLDPDIAVHQTATDIANGLDRQMEFAVQTLLNS